MSKQVSISFPPDLYNKINTLAKLGGVSFGAMARILISDSLQRKKL